MYTYVCMYDVGGVALGGTLTMEVRKAQYGEGLLTNH